MNQYPQQQHQEDPYISRIEFDRYKKFQNMQASSIFIQIEQLKTYIKQAIPVKPIPKEKRETLDKIVPKLQQKLNFLEVELNKMYNQGKKKENGSEPSREE